MVVISERGVCVRLSRSRMGRVDVSWGGEE